MNRPLIAGVFPTSRDFAARISEITSTRLAIVAFADHERIEYECPY